MQNCNTQNYTKNSYTPVNANNIYKVSAAIEIDNLHHRLEDIKNYELDDIKDLGLWHNDKWDFYLTRDELETMGVPKDFIDHTLAVEKDLDMEKE